MADAKAYARVDDSADDTLIGTLITAARKRVEKETGLALMPQTWVAVFDRWPGADDRGLSAPWWDGTREAPISSILGAAAVIEIPKRPFNAVTSINLRDATGGLNLVDSSIYYSEVSDWKGRILRKLGTVWPIVVLAQSSAIEVTFTCGWPDAASVPADLVLAVKILVKHWYDNRDLLNEGRAVPVPHHVGEILGSWRNVRL